MVDRLESETAQAWDDLELALQQWLADVPPDGCVVIELPWPEGEGAGPYVQLAVDGYGVHAEAVSNNYLARCFLLNPARIAMLCRLGWSMPRARHDVAERPLNYVADDVLPDAAAQVATRLVATLRDVHGVPHPSFLVVRGFDAEGSLDPDDLPFGLRIAAPARPPVDLSAMAPRDPDQLRDLVAEIVAGITGEEVEFDADGDLPVPSQHTTVFVRVDEDSPTVSVFAPLLHDVRWTPRVGHALNQANRHLRYAKVYFEGGWVVVHLYLPGMPFAPDQLRLALESMGGLVEMLIARLQEQIGGRLMDQPPAPR